jgi:hypothetical protein
VLDFLCEWLEDIDERATGSKSDSIGDSGFGEGGGTQGKW